MRTDIEKLLELVQSGKLKVLVDKIFPLAEAREALRVIEDREVFGKIVVAP
jgi:alcohol dehydrogenase